MSPAIPVTAALSFAATNIDDLVLLAIFYSQANRRWKVVAGQFLGFTVIIVISLTGFISGRLLNPQWIRFLGIVPIVIGIKKLIARDEEKDTQRSSGVAGIALVTFANGGDNIGIYAPLFATANAAELSTFIGVYYALLGVWCCLGYLIAQHPLVARVLNRYGKWIVPFVLIALGIYILAGY
jgi:cadmium resistance protein CadD (predicted permease)